MLSKAEALDLIRKHLNDTPRAAHSRFVAYVMRELASVLAANAGRSRASAILSPRGLRNNGQTANRTLERPTSAASRVLRGGEEVSRRLPRTLALPCTPAMA